MKLILALCLVLTGCATNPCVLQTEPIHIDQRVFEPCENLVVPEGQITAEIILETTAANAVIYTSCKAKHDANIILIKKLTNQKDVK